MVLFVSNKVWGDDKCVRPWLFPTLAFLLSEPQILTAASLCLLGGIFSLLPFVLGKDCLQPLNEVTFPSTLPSGRFQSHFWPIDSDQLGKIAHPVAAGKSQAKHCQAEEDRAPRAGQWLAVERWGCTRSLE